MFSILQVGITAFMDLFKISPETIETFRFLRAYHIEDEEFHDLLSKHALRVSGLVSLLIKEVFNILQFLLAVSATTITDRFCYHISIYPFILYALWFQLKSKSPEAPNDCIQETMFPLGRKHFSYGSNVNHMELLGVLIVRSLLKALPKDEIDPGKYVEIHQAFIAFFGLMIYWLQFGYKYQSKYTV